MLSGKISFEPSQFNRLFPFYILINRDLVIESYGKSLEKLFPGIAGTHVSDALFFRRPQLMPEDLSSLGSLINQLLIIQCKNKAETILRGQIEPMPETGHMIFIGSPWFGSMKEVIENKLRLDDFAYHDPVIDMLHLLKTQEITTNELKTLLQTIKKQKDDLKAATREIQDIALFPMQNPDPLIRINFSGKILKLNPAAEKFTEFTYQNQTYSAAEFWHIIAGRTDINKEREEIEVKSGDTWLSFVVKPLPSDGYCNIYGRDVTENKKREEQLLILSSIAAENTHGVVIADKEGRIEWANRSFEEMTGYTIDEIRGSRPGALLQGKDSDPETVAYLRKQVRSGEPFIAEILNYHKSGKPYWLRIQGQALKDREGRIMKYFAIEEDITTEKETHQKLREFERRFRVALEKLGDNVWEHDFSTGQTVFSNPNSHFLGYKFDNKEQNDNLWWNSVCKEDLQLLAETSNRIRNGEIGHYTLEYRIYHADGSVRWVHDRGVVIEKDINGAPNIIIGTHSDVTHHKEIEQALIEAKNNAEASGRLKESFLANMSHEIRTPLNAVIGMLREFSRETLPPRQSMLLKNASLASQHLLSIVNDILDLSKIESGQMVLSRRPFDMREVILDAITILSPMAGEKMLKLETSISPSLAPAYMGDSHRIRQVLLNLINNAIKFTDEGTITLECSIIEKVDESHLITIKITDTGIGMDKLFVNRIFDKFIQDENSAGRKYGGTGLGLSIVKELVSIMSGTINVESEPGKGTTVEVSICFDTAGESERRSKAIVENYNTLQGKKILLAEDNDLNRMVAENLLTFHGASVTHATNGKEAVDRLNIETFDAVLMDLQMPVMGGMEATEIIRRDMKLEVPVIALTANAFKAESERCMAVGMNDYITKPYEENVLLEAIIRCIMPASCPLPAVQHVEEEGLYSLGYIQQFSRGNNAFIGKMIAEFIDQTPKVVNDIKDAYRSGDLKAVQSLAHKIKSNIDMFGISELKAEIRNIESMAKEKHTSAELEKLINKLDNIIKKVVNKLKNEANYTGN